MDFPPLTLAVLTYHRNDLLRSALPLLTAQVAQAVEAGHAPRLVVVDNSPEGEAREVVEAHATSGDVRYVHEPTPGLAAARNRALDEAEGTRLFCFIDDDETPGEGWLLDLVACWRRTGASAVSGPVRSLPETPLDAWTEGTGLFARPTRPTGSPRPGMASNNLLLDLDFVRRHHIRFDERFGFTGGEDSKFGQDLQAAGGRIVWCDEAEVSEVVPAARLERDWIRQRLTRFGESWVRARSIDMTGREAAVFRARTAAKGSAKVAKARAQLELARRRGDERAQGAAEAELAGGLGMVRGAAGVNRQEYGRA